MGIPVIDTGPMTVEEFYAFTDARPDGEKWELIDGKAVLNASPSRLHQRILKNLVIALGDRERELRASWEAIPGIGVRVSETNRPEPDLMIMPKHVESHDPLERDTKNAIVLFEIMSPSTSSRDLKWKRAAYASMPALTHYVVVAQDAVDVVVFARDGGFAEQRFKSLDAVIAFPALGVSLPLFEVYRDLELS